MKRRIKESWRQPMWMWMMNRLPATISINLKTHSYTVRDNSLQCIYMDDIDEAGVDEIMQELAEQLGPAGSLEFREKFSVEQLKRAWRENQKGYTLLSPMEDRGAVALKTDVVFGQGAREMIIEFRFDISSILSDWPTNRV